MDSLGKTLKS